MLYDAKEWIQSALRRKVQEIADMSGFKIKVVEKGGKTIKSMLRKSDVEPPKKCWDS